MCRYPTDAVVVASLPIGIWEPNRASVAITEDADFLVTVHTSESTILQRRFPLSTMRPPTANDPPGSLVFLEYGERLVLPVQGDIPALVAFSSALAAAVDGSRWP